jgi:predicted signal transduction protein with EAL and GGDEF domain
VTDGTVTDYNLLFQWADAALYQVKSKGKGAYYLLDVTELLSAIQNPIYMGKEVLLDVMLIARDSI